MAMLAEKRTKVRFVLTPVSKPLWMSENNGVQTGKRLMEKMGWSAGKGLGASEQGIAEPLRSSYKQDSKGMGYKGDGNPFENLDQFNALLASLPGNNTGSEAIEQSYESLEEKSKHSRSRVHYKKFTRGKDLSKYSSNDLSCIVGIGRKVEKIEEQDEEREVERTGEEEHSHGVTTIFSGSIADYFKNKLELRKATQEGLRPKDYTTVENVETSETTEDLDNETTLTTEKGTEETMQTSNFQDEEAKATHDQHSSENEIDNRKKHKKKHKKDKSRELSEESKKNDESEREKSIFCKDREEKHNQATENNMEVLQDETSIDSEKSRKHKKKKKRDDPSEDSNSRDTAITEQKDEAHHVIRQGIKVLDIKANKGDVSEKPRKHKKKKKNCDDEEDKTSCNEESSQATGHIISEFEVKVTNHDEIENGRKQKKKHTKDKQKLLLEEEIKETASENIEGANQEVVPRKRAHNEETEEIALENCQIVKKKHKKDKNRYTDRSLEVVEESMYQDEVVQEELQRKKQKSRKLAENHHVRDNQESEPNKTSTPLDNDTESTKKKKKKKKRDSSDDEEKQDTSQEKKRKKMRCGNESSYVEEAKTSELLEAKEEMNERKSKNRREEKDCPEPDITWENSVEKKVLQSPGLTEINGIAKSFVGSNLMDVMGYGISRKSDSKRREPDLKVMNSLELSMKSK